MNGTIVTYDNTSEIVKTSLSEYRIKNLASSLVASKVTQSGKEGLELLFNAILEDEEKELGLETTTSLNTMRKVLLIFPFVCLTNSSKDSTKSKNQHLVLSNSISCNSSSIDATKSSSYLKHRQLKQL